jgi:hypothetical protein
MGVFMLYNNFILKNFKIFSYIFFLDPKPSPIYSDYNSPLGLGHVQKILAERSI